MAAFDPQLPLDQPQTGHRKGRKRTVQLPTALRLPPGGSGDLEIPTVSLVLRGS